jgi:hypothetical protein
LLASCAAACIERQDITSAAWTCEDDADPPTWSLVSAAVTQPSCGTASCHSALTQRAGIVLDSAAAGYRSLVEAEPEPFVRPGSPQGSRVLYLLNGVEVARTMPPDAPLPGADIDLVRRWICAGAEND